MTVNRYDRQAAARHIAGADPVLGRLIDRFGPCRLRVERQSDPFSFLSRSIIFQQLSGKAADTIFGRFSGLFGDGGPDAATALALDKPALRGAGLSNNKCLSILDLAEKTLAGQIPPRRKMLRMRDEAVIDSLCVVRGIGPWTAQMFLMFNLGRPDVMPAGDLGIQRGIMQAYDLDRIPIPGEVLQRAVAWRPYRTVASWYLWLAADAQP